MTTLDRKVRTALRAIEDAEAEVRLAKRLLFASIVPFVLMLTLWTLPIVKVVIGDGSTAGCITGGVMFLIAGCGCVGAWLSSFIGADKDSTAWANLRAARRNYEDLMMEEF